MLKKDLEFWPILILTVLITLFGIAKLSYNPSIGIGALDGEYYYQIARHVRDGNSLSTSVSLYNRGLETLPHLTNQSPAWPVALGYVSRIWDLHSAAHILPEILFLIDLALLYIVANLIAERSGLNSGPSLFSNRFIQPGHIAVLIFGLSRPFFEFSSLPYTEALAFFFALTSVALCDLAATRNSLAYAFLAGVAAALAFLSRAQFVGVLVALPLALAIPNILNKKFPRLTVLTSLGITVALVPWLSFLSSWLPNLTFKSFLGLGSFKGSGEIPGFKNRIVTEGHLDWLLDRLSGLATSFDIFSSNSYVTAFGPAAYLVPLSLVLLLTTKLNWRSSYERLSSPNTCIIVASFLIGLSALLPIHNSHFNWFKEWLFGHRHGLPLIFILIISISYLMLSKNRFASVLSGIIVIVGLFIQIPWVNHQIIKHYEPSQPRSEILELSAWLDSQSPDITSVTTLAQTLSTHSRSNFHWATCSGSARSTRAILQHTSAEYVIVFPHDRKCNFVRGIGNILKLETAFGTESYQIQVFKHVTTQEART